MQRPEPLRGVEAYPVGDAAVRAGAESQQRGIDLLELRRQSLRGRERGRSRRRKEVAEPAQRAAAPVPLPAALRNTVEQRFRARQRRRDLVAPDDGALESLERRHLAHADVPLAVAGELCRRIGRTNLRHEDQDDQQDRHHGDARGDREFEERRRPSLTHARLAPGR